MFVKKIFKAAVGVAALYGVGTYIKQVKQRLKGEEKKDDYEDRRDINLDDYKDYREIES